ncbi:transposase, partial [Brevundimonas sp.]|uniref:transposase n=1 Tax=Brevundimonas sp. TaxID=1871086 RepID=UPI0035673DBA
VPGPTVIAPPSTSGARALPADAQGEGDLRAWIERGRASLVASFANGVDRDIKAVRAEITSGWSNGQTEDQITKLKLAKRHMYGRRKLDLLQARLIGSTP